MTQYCPVPTIHPNLYSRFVLELWEYKWNGGRQDYDRVCYQPLHLMEPRGNPAPNVTGLSAYPSNGGPIPLGALDPTTIGLLQPHLARRQDQPGTPPPLVRTFPGQDQPRQSQPRQDQPRRPLAPVLGRATPDILDILGPGPQHPPAPEHVIVLDSPSSPDSSPPSSPVNTPPKKERAPSPPVSSSRVLCEGPRYILRQDHQFQCPECPLPSSPTLNGNFDIGMHGEAWPRHRLAAPSPTSSFPVSGNRRRAPSPPPPRMILPPARSDAVEQHRLLPRGYRLRTLFLAPFDLGICLSIFCRPSPDHLQRPEDLPQRHQHHRPQSHQHHHPIHRHLRHFHLQA